MTTTVVPRSRRRRPHDSSTTLNAAASAWLFTPDRTSSVLVERSADALSGAATVVADAALEYAAAAALVASNAPGVEVVQTIVYRAPFFSLAVSFLLGGLFFSTLAAIVTGVIALGRENTRRAKEVLLFLSSSLLAY